MMKLSLSTDFGSPEHWERVVDFAAQHGVSRLVFWWDFSNAPYREPCLYPKYPGIVPENELPERRQLQERLRKAAEMAAGAGVEFWYVFQALMLPESEHVLKAYPELFNAAGEPDMSGDLIYQLLRDQLDEVLELAPNLAGCELWVMECARIAVASLSHQDLPIPEISSRIVETVYAHTREKNMGMTQDLHTSGGDTATLGGLLAGARRHPDIIVSADNVIGDYHLHLPFNSHLVRAAETNPIQVNFDLNGEYWGRNFIPTSGLSQYAEHLEIARRLNAVIVNGRVSTGHDAWSPHANVLPSRRRFYPRLESIDDATSLPSDLEITCTDTLGAFSAEFFCRRAKDPGAEPEESVRSFLRSEFGEEAVALTPQFMQLESVLAGVFYVDKNYHACQSVAFSPELIDAFALGEQMVCEPGTAFPSEEIMQDAGGAGWRAAFAGWPAPLNHVCAGPEAIIAEKAAAAEGAEAILSEVVRVTEKLDRESRAFLRRQFEDLAIFARGFRYLAEAQIHFHHMKYGRQQGDIPNPKLLAELVARLDEVAAEWEARYPGGRYLFAERLREWVQFISQFLSETAHGSCNS